MMGLGNGAVERAQRPKPEDAGTIWGVAESLQRQQPEYIFEKNKQVVLLSANAMIVIFSFREQPKASVGSVRPPVFGSTGRDSFRPGSYATTCHRLCAPRLPRLAR